jgi:drug/metabolite transporter (DMT)-like permease
MNLTLNTWRALTRLLYLSLINAWAATRATLVTCVFPPAGRARHRGARRAYRRLVLGIVVLGEPIDCRLLAGTPMIVTGIVVVNARVFGTLGSRAVSKN